MKNFFTVLIILFFIINIHSIDNLQVQEAKKDMEKAFSEYANYISVNSSSDDYADRLYHNYISLKNKYEKLKELYQATKYTEDKKNLEYFFSPNDEARINNQNDVDELLKNGPDYKTDYRLGWFMFVKGKYDFSIRLFKQSLKKAEVENIFYTPAHLGLARVYTLLAEKNEQDRRENYKKAQEHLKIFSEKFSFSDDILDRKRNYLFKEIKSRLNYLSELVDNANVN